MCCIFVDSGAKANGGVRSKSETHPPPIPPLPVNYTPSGPSGSGRHQGSIPRTSAEDSFSEPDDDSRATAVSTPTHDSISSTGSLNRRQSRMHRRMARQAQLKRLRMAQEIQRQLEEVEVKQRELEQRDEDEAGAVDEAELLREWFELVRERSELRRYEHELVVRAEELQLEDRHARLQQELRDRLANDDSNKTSEDVAKEGQILGEMLEIVERRDSLIALLEEDRQRYQEEDRDFEAQMLAKGLRLTPLRKESNVNLPSGWSSNTETSGKLWKFLHFFSFWCVLEYFAASVIAFTQLGPGGGFSLLGDLKTALYEVRNISPVILY
ncbi:Uncharacterized protein GBIM_20010 [Gryllus bimaculatus]|nr:Uncharacterized protein GBIM_20010 [Gryllus bimaculatus]